MKMTVAIVNVSGVVATANWIKLITRGIVGANVQIVYDSTVWIGLRKTVVFEGSGVIRDVLDAGEIVEIPPEVASEANSRIRMGIYGVSDDGSVVVPTIWAELGRVRDSADPSGDESTAPELPVWAQLDSRVKKLESQAPSDGDSSAFYIAISEENGSYVMDKTFPELKEAHETGRPVYAIVNVTVENLRVNNAIFQFSNVFDAFFVFTHLENSILFTAFVNQDGISFRVKRYAEESSIPNKLPNPNVLTFTGAVSGTYDGSDPVTIDIPNASGGNAEDGFSPIAKVEQTATGAIVSITDKTGTTTATINNGKDGKDGDDGDDGVTPHIGANGNWFIGEEDTGVPTYGSGINVSGATPGQTIKVKAVDENGKPTEWEAVDFPEGGGATSWEDLGSTFEEGTVLAETSPTYNEDEQSFFISGFVPVVAGETYAVNWNGVKYTCTAMAFSPFEGIEAVALGDIGAVEGEPITGEPFFIMCAPADMIDESGIGAQLVALDGSTEVTLSITGIVEKITPVPEKYISRLPVYYIDLIETEASKNDNLRKFIISLDTTELFEVLKSNTAVLFRITSEQGFVNYVQMSSYNLFTMSGYIEDLEKTAEELGYDLDLSKLALSLSGYDAGNDLRYLVWINVTD